VRELEKLLNELLEDMLVNPQTVPYAFWVAIEELAHPIYPRQF
jgi:hypothetical protein